MENKSIYDEIFYKSCSVCGKIIKKDIYDQGDCPYCKWIDKEFAKIKQTFLEENKKAKKQ